MLTLERTISIATLLDTAHEQAVGILAGAFGDTPLARYCFADQAEHHDRAVRAYARLDVARRAAAGGMHLAAYHDEHLVGIAGIVPPDPAPRTDALHSQWLWFAALVGPQAAGRIARTERLIAQHRPAAPHCTLGALGVLPAASGLGAGRALLDAARDYAGFYPAATGIFALAASPDGIAFYQRAGYRVLGREASGGLTIACLFRPRDA